MTAPARLLMLVALVAALALAACAMADLRSAARGWLTGFVVCSAAPLGAVALSAVGRLTGGAWAEPLKPVALATPVLLVLVLPVLIGLPLLYPWAGPVEAPAPLGIYLSAPAFIARSLVALVGWAVLAVLLGRGRAGRPLAALALVFHGVMISVVGVDWVLSTRPGWVASDFGLTMAASGVLAATGVVLASGRVSGQAARDLCGLMIAGALGTTYLAFMDFLVVWYADLPDRIAPYAVRLVGAWGWAPPAAVLTGLLLPLGLLGLGRGRAEARKRIAGGFGLVGMVLFVLWMLAPEVGALAALSALPAIALQGAVLALASGRVVRRVEARA